MESPRYPKTGLVLLAAGASTRLGKPKQNLLYEGKTLLQRAIHTANRSLCTRVIVVLSANTSGALPDDLSKSIFSVQNEAWEEGMASSIRCGLEKVLAVEPEVESCMFMVCDQPFVEEQLLHEMMLAKQQSGKGIVASAYAETLGTPVLFDRKYFKELLSLQGQEGAKKIIMRHRIDAVPISFPLGTIDIDTVEDYASLIRGGQ
ncbi:nucleotidyltransferase family protein [Pontibacter korlensis]|uniref:MobA-like NTP transferase domain-containing protein n=1 Tax=Pontibacter korlensis TaxID=400092 RepID=A0A0E3ZHT9_9BACT|nr:nucleotidyltransferase family protein [Pontibacter korlensis]AKD04205.1 hypothetical protein PKOR_15295 [Pontibacter korlensis]